MSAIKKKNRNKKNKSKKPKGRKPKSKSLAQGMTTETALNNLAAVCSEFVGKLADHNNLQVSLALVKGKVKALETAKARIAELEEALEDADGEDEVSEDETPEDEVDENDDDDDAEDEDGEEE